MSDQDSPVRGFRPLMDSEKKKEESQLTGASPAASAVPVQPLSSMNQTSTSQTGRRQTFCTFCGFPNDAASRFCNNCGKPLSQSIAAAPAYPGQPLSGSGAYRPAAQSARGYFSTGSLLAVLGALFALICFFMPFNRLKISIPTSIFFGGKDTSISIDLTMWQYMANRSPSVKGLGSLGEMATNLYNEINMGDLMAQAVGDDVRVGMFILRVVFLLILLGHITTLVLILMNTTQNIASGQAGKIILTLSVISAVLVIILGILISTGFSESMKSIFGEYTSLAKSAINASLGFGFWGTLIGCFLIGIGGFYKKNE